VRRRVCRLVKVDHTVLQVCLQVTLEWTASNRQRRVVAALDVQLVVILRDV
jgi:hypothetical protein